MHQKALFRHLILREYNLYIKKQYKSDGMSMSGYVLGSGLSPDLTEEEIKEMMCSLLLF